MIQKQIFLDGEGDQYYERNKKTKRENYMRNEDLANMIISLPFPKDKHVKVVEIGCGTGERLKRIRSATNWKVAGIDPSRKSIEELEKNKVQGYVGTAERLPFQDQSIDILVYGFCLYLCDRQDMFSIAAEANRVIKAEGWIAIIDFWTKENKENRYRHHNDVISYKTRSEEMFVWHPHYVVMDHKVRYIGTDKYTDETENWVSSTIIRKCANQ